MSIKTPILAAAAALWALPALGATPVRLPPGESEAAWEAAFTMADLEPAAVGTESAVLIEDRGTSWVLWARDPTGIVREVEVDEPRSAQAREDVAWLIVSLQNPSPTVDLGLPPREAPRRTAPPPRPPVTPAVEPVASVPPPEEPRPDEVEEAVEPAEVIVVEEPPPSPSELLTWTAPPEEVPLAVEFELSEGYEPFRPKVLPFASLTATTEGRLRALPTPGLQLAGGVDIVGRVRAGISFGATAYTMVAVDASTNPPEPTFAGSLEVMAFGAIALDPRRRVWLDFAAGARNMRYVPVAWSWNDFHPGEDEFLPTLRVEAGYAFKVGRSLAVMPTLGIQGDVLDDSPVSSRPGTMLPVSVRFGLRLVALRDVSFHLARLPAARSKKN